MMADAIGTVIGVVCCIWLLMIPVLCIADECQISIPRAGLQIYGSLLGVSALVMLALWFFRI